MLPAAVLTVLAAYVVALVFSTIGDPAILPPAVLAAEIECQYSVGAAVVSVEYGVRAAVVSVEEDLVFSLGVPAIQVVDRYRVLQLAAPC